MTNPPELRLEADHIAQLIYLQWTQGPEDTADVFEELQAIPQHFQNTGTDGGLIGPGACDDTDLPHGSSCAEAVARAIEMHCPGSEINQ